MTCADLKAGRHAHPSVPDLTILTGRRRAPRDSVCRGTAPCRSEPEPAAGVFDVVAYCDGSLVRGAKDAGGVWSGLGGWGVVLWSAAAPRSPEGWCGPLGRVSSSSAAELAALAHALRLAPPGRLLVRTDSQVALQWVASPRDPYAASDPAVMAEVLAAIEARAAPVVLQWVRGHDRDHGNARADKMARHGARVGEPGWTWGAGRQPVRAGPLPSPGLGRLA